MGLTPGGYGATFDYSTLLPLAVGALVLVMIMKKKSREENKMITDPEKVSILWQIAGLFYPSNPLGRTSSMTRMQSQLSNETYQYFISNLQTGTFYVAQDIGQSDLKVYLVLLFGI